MMDSDIEAILSRHVSEDTAAGLDFSSPGREREMEFPDSLLPWLSWLCAVTQNDTSLRDADAEAGVTVHLDPASSC